MFQSDTDVDLTNPFLTDDKYVYLNLTSQKHNVNMYHIYDN